MNLNLTPDKILTVIFRVEAGCLGPEGESHIVEFCSFAHNSFTSNQPHYINWQILPRHDKHQAELQYTLSNKTLSHNKASRYLHLFNENIDAFEESLNEKLILLIDEYLGN